MNDRDTYSENWIKHPLKCVLGTIWLSGYLRNNNHIPVNKMRILGKHALVLVLTGKVYYQDGEGRKDELGEGSVMWLPQDLPHAYGTIDGQPWSQAYVVFDGPQFELLQSSSYIRSRQPLMYLDAIHSWKDRLKGIIKTGIDPDPAQVISTMGKFVNFLTDMVSRDSTAISAGSSWFRKSVQLMGEQHDGTWHTPQEVATLVGMGYENFRKQFTNHSGKSPARYQRELKMELACTMIYQEALSFKELAEKLGFCDIYHFSKAFRQFKGCTPSDYRRSVRGH